MCWNAEVSLNTFYMGIFGILLALLNKTSYVNIFYYLTVVLMQLLEYFGWTYYNNMNANFIVSLCNSFLLLIQPIATILTLYAFKNKHNIMKNMLIIYISLLFIYLLTNKFNKNMYYIYKGSNGHLVWNWLSKKNINILHLLIYLFFFIYPLYIGKLYIPLFAVIGTLLISLYTYYKYDTWTSMWCWIASIIIFFSLIFKYLLNI